MDTNVVVSVIACGAAVLTCAITTGLILWKGGGQAERVETSVRRIEGIEKKLEVLAMIPVFETRMGTLENVVSRMQSDHRALAERVAVIGDRATRAEIASQHDIGE